jgi:hypothetical protein
LCRWAISANPAEGVADAICEPAVWFARGLRLVDCVLRSGVFHAKDAAVLGVAP